MSEIELQPRRSVAIENGLSALLRKIRVDQALLRRLQDGLRSPLIGASQLSPELPANPERPLRSIDDVYVALRAMERKIRVSARRLPVHEAEDLRLSARSLAAYTDQWHRSSEAIIDERKTRETLFGFRKKKFSVPEHFDEDAYLHANPDVAAAVRNRTYPTGYRHWVRVGRSEGRAAGPVTPVADRKQYIPLMQKRAYGVNFYGFLSTISGLGSVARGCVRALDAVNIPLNKIDVAPWKGGVEPSRALPKFPPYRINLIQQNADMFQRFVGAYGENLLHGSYNIGYWLWELPSARSDSHGAFRYVDEVWAPSEFCRHAFQTLTSLPVVRIPLVVDGLEKNSIYGRDHFGFSPDVLVFGYVFDVSSYLARKNPFCLIEAFQREFGDSGNVLLYLKVTHSERDPAAFQSIVDSVAGAPNIRIVTRLFDDAEIASLHGALDCLVSPHRSEGFGFNLAEAMYFGKPVIGTRYSAPLDFMNDENSYLIDYDLIPIAQSVGPYLKGSVWADPSVEHLQHLLRTVLEDKPGRERKGQAAAATIRRDLSADAVGRLTKGRFEQLGLDQAILRRDLIKVHPAPARPKLMLRETPPAVAKDIRSFLRRPVISILTPVYNVKAEYLTKCIESVRAQHYPFWELCICDDSSTLPETREILAKYVGMDSRIKIVWSDQNLGIAGASNRAAEISTGEFLALLDNDDEIAPDALFEIAKAVNENPTADFFYTDEDKIEPDGSFSDHYCKPDWSPDHLRSVMYVLHMMVVRKELFYSAGAFRDAFSGAQDYDLALRLSEQAAGIHHIPKILYHWRKIAGSAAATLDAKPQALDAARRALVDHVKRHDPLATVESGKLEGFHRVKYAIRGNPLVSLCITTDDRSSTVEGRGTFNLVEHFVKSIAHKTDYPNYEIVIVDNGNLSERTRRSLSGIPYRLESYRGVQRPFNFARKANFAFGQIRGEHLVLLNDDLEVISSEWLRALLEFSQQPEVGVVGARLIFPDERIQHCGVAIGINKSAAHLYHNYPSGFVGYNGFTHAIRNYSAVTGACMATRKSVIEEVGGFDERLAIDFNDIDFCLSAVDLGYRVVYTPYAELYHFEGASVQRKAQSAEEVELFTARWADFIERDPYYNPNLTREGVDFSLVRR